MEEQYFITLLSAEEIAAATPNPQPLRGHGVPDVMLIDPPEFVLDGSLAEHVDSANHRPIQTHNLI